MRRSTTKYLLSVGLLSLSTLTLASSCADNNSSLFLVGVIGLDSATCVAKPDTSAVLMAQGTLDLAFTRSYTAFLLIGNQLTQRGSREQLRTETSRVTLRGAEVTLTKIDGSTIGEFSTVGTGFVNEAAGDVPSYAAMSVNLIPGQLGMTLETGVVLAKIRAFGETLGGTSVTSSELDFPINICTGCLVRYPADAADPLQGQGAPYKCTTATTATTTAIPACILGQDQVISCITCSSAYAVCRDPAMNPSYQKP